MDICRNRPWGAGMLLAACLLAGCGGGGSDAPPVSNDPGNDPPPVSNDPTSLTVTSSLSVALEGDGPITLTSSPGKGSAISWTVSPPIGELSADTGDSITFTPPSLNVLASDTTVKITASSSGVTSGSVSIPVFRSALSVSADGVAGNSMAGQSVSLPLIGTPNIPLSGALYARVDDPKGVLKPTATVVANQGGTYTIELQASDTIFAATYSATATVTVCADEACSTPLRGRPLAVPYSLEVAGNTGLVPIQPWAGVADWATYQGNIAHTAYMPVTLKPLRIGKRWEWTSPLLHDYPQPIAAPVVSGGIVYLNAGNTIQALHEFDSSSAWSYDVTDISLVSNNGAQAPAVFNGRVYFSGGHQDTTYLFSMDAIDGALQWKSLMSSQWEEYFAPIVVGTDVYTQGGTYGGLYGFDGTGNQLFFAYSEQTDHWSPAADQNYIYTYTGSPAYAYFRQFDRKTGALLRTIQDDGFEFTSYEMHTAPVVTGTGSVIGVDQYTAIMRFDVDNEIISWRQLGGYIGNPAYANGVLYAANTSPVQLEARDEPTGALKWQWAPQSADEESFIGDVIATNNLVFVSTTAAVYAIDLDTHAAVWSYPKPGRLALASSGILYLATTDQWGQSDGVLIAFNLN